jgi:hypothetical protein
VKDPAATPPVHHKRGHPPGNCNKKTLEPLAAVAAAESTRVAPTAVTAAAAADATAAAPTGAAASTALVVTPI